MEENQLVKSVNAFQNKRVLITGGLGFIGSNLAIHLVGLDAKITLIDSLIPEYGGNLFNIEPVKGSVAVNIADVRDESSMNWLVKDQDYIFNLAGTLSHIDSMKDPYTDLEINCRSQLTILEACRKNNPDVKIVFSGTRGQYGKAKYLPVDEKHPLEPTDVNGINNMAGEWYHILYNNVYGIRATSLRLTNTYGPRHQMKHSRQGYLNWFIRLAMDDETITLYDDGKQLRDFNYVDDVVNALLLSAALEEADGEIFNLGSGQPISVKDSLTAVLDATRSGRMEQVPFPSDKKKIEVGDYYADYGKIKRLLGWEPKIPFKAGLDKTVEYYRKHRNYYWNKT